jgi:DNA-binding IscR family transcriptional regulator
MDENTELTLIKNRPLERIFRNNIARVIDFLIINQQFNFTTAEISKSSEIPLRTVQRIIPQLVQNKIVIENKHKGKVKNYELNRNSKLVEILRLYSIETVNVFIDEALDEKRTRALISNSKLARIHPSTTIN